MFVSCCCAGFVFHPPEIIAKLYELALIGDINELTDRVNDLAQSDSRLQPFVAKINLFLKRYQLDEISDWLARHRATKEI